MTAPSTPDMKHAKDDRPASEHDVDVGEATVRHDADDLHRALKPRQVDMLAIAGAIGTGLIIGSGSGLAHGGPASLLIAYMLIGAVVYFVMTAMGEMATWLPMKKGFAGYATRFVDPAFGFATGWNYFFKYAIVLPNNLTAAGIILQYWRPDINVAVWITVFGVVIILLNVLHVRWFGEAEFWLSAIKVVVLLGLILACLVISLGGSPSHDRIGFRYWRDPGAFAPYLAEGSTGKFLGFWACVVQACFAYTGTEIIGAAFGEVPNPRKNVPKTVRQTLLRICCFYVLGVFVLGMAVPYDNERLIGATKEKTSAAASPFVVAITLARIKVLPDIVNGALLVFVISAANSDIYVASRALFGMAKDGQAPALFKRTTAAGVPLAGVAAAALFILLGYMNVSKSASTVFGYFVSLVTVFGTLNWVSILVSYLCMRRGMLAQGVDMRELPYRDPLQPYGAWFALVVTVLVIFFNGFTAFVPHFKADTFVTSYIGVVVYLANIVWWKCFKGTKRVQPNAMDLGKE
ncbi:Dicarboxylic amino acid permease [Lasiodiplodia theobromae]|uniref:Dicarboxylic amino acid permease n=1 Tax=Lasiodiplodia theobromae TaxID=45133 RepID=UPI0015C394BA|nr:Dicarboxylic amino acid permease [Lasiodiplodia theobromae]KAF4535214.1 Dicarboxylic amino acid permease [Lasiodiplodia theobromae]